MRHFTSNDSDQCQNGSSNLLTPYREQPRPTRIVVAYPLPAFSATKRTSHASIGFNRQAFQGHISYGNKEKYNTEINRGEGLELVKLASEPASSRSKPCTSLKKHHKSCSWFAAPRWPSLEKPFRGQRSAFPSENFKFAHLVLAHRGSALPWLVDNRAALRSYRIWCVPTR